MERSEVGSQQGDSIGLEKALTDWLPPASSSSGPPELMIMSQA
jgi:hypothetical protein